MLYLRRIDARNFVDDLLRLWCTGCTKSIYAVFSSIKFSYYRTMYEISRNTAINCNNVKSFYSYYVYIYLQLRSWVANLQTISLLFHSPYAKKHVHIHTYCTRIRVSFERLPRFLIIVMFVTCSSLRRRERGRCFVTLGMK